MKENVYIPFNMIIDTDYGIIRIIEETQSIKNKMDENKLKKLLIDRTEENPLYRFIRVTGIDVFPSSYDYILDKYYNENLFKISAVTDMLNFVSVTHNMGVWNDLRITVGCDYQCEIDYLTEISNILKVPITACLNTQLKLNRYQTIFTKFIDENYVDWLLNVENVEKAKLYVANYGFNTLLEEESHQAIVDPVLHMRLESKGIILSLVDIYNHLDDK